VAALVAVARSGQEVVAAQVHQAVRVALLWVEGLLMRQVVAAEVGCVAAEMLQVVAAEVGCGAAEVAAAVLLQFPH
jgi:hypothetical protein